MIYLLDDNFLFLFKLFFKYIDRLFTVLSGNFDAEKIDSNLLSNFIPYKYIIIYIYFTFSVKYVLKDFANFILKFKLNNYF